MKNALLLFSVLLLLSASKLFPQTLNDYLSAVKGDTLVIKDYYEMNNRPNSLAEVLRLDTTDVPEGRIYELKAGGYYPNYYIQTPKRSIVIIGPDTSIIVNNKNAELPPPLICDAAGVKQSEMNASIQVNGNLTIKNCRIIPAAEDGSTAKIFAEVSASNLRLLFDNCLCEHITGVLVYSEYPGCDFIFRNCYFVNMSGYPCRRDGGVFDSFEKQDSLLVENCTFIMAQGNVWRLRAYPFKRIFFNHNTFINMAGSVFMNLGYQSRMYVVNNIFINCNIQPYPGIHTIDYGEQDPDRQPMGLINVYQDSADEANKTPRIMWCGYNIAYWDPIFDNVIQLVDSDSVNGVTTWMTQMLLMNLRTRQMFDNKTKYPYLTEGSWLKDKPDFTDSKDLLSTQLTVLKDFAIAAVDTSNAVVLPDWRLINTGPDNFIYPDWPVPVDLAYSNPDLITGGLSGFPVGDLNWFPAQKAAWLAQRNEEYANIDWIYYDAVKDPGILPSEFRLLQNYPNPFNPSTKIQYAISSRQLVILKVYDMLGREVATLVNEEQKAGNYEVEFNGSNLASGIYIYRLKAGNFIATKKMLLIK